MTPGPWNYEWAYTLLRYSRKQTGPWDDFIDDGNHPDDSDANLIAAAPELLAAAAGFLTAWDNDDFSMGMKEMRNLRAAIARARGES